MHEVQEGKQGTNVQHPSAGTADWRGLWAPHSSTIKSSSNLTEGSNFGLNAIRSLLFPLLCCYFC